MPLINPVYTLPNYNVDRLSEAEGKNRQRDRKNDKKPKDTDLKQSDSSEQNQVTQDESVLDLKETSQVLDTETVVKLLENQLKNQNVPENDTLSASSRYDHVKKLTDSSKLNREI